MTAFAQAAAGAGKVDAAIALLRIVRSLPARFRCASSPRDC